MNANFNAQPVISGDMAGNVTSQPSDLWRCRSASYEIEYLGSPTGTFEVMATNHWDPRLDPTYTAFKAVTLAVPIPAAAGVPGNALVDLTDFPYRWILLKYTFNAGAGALNVWIAGKE